MPGRLRFATCAHHATEVERALRAEGQADVEVISFPARCFMLMNASAQKGT